MVCIVYCRCGFLEVDWVLDKVVVKVRRCGDILFWLWYLPLYVCWRSGDPWYELRNRWMVWCVSVVSVFLGVSVYIVLLRVIFKDRSHGIIVDWVLTRRGCYMTRWEMRWWFSWCRICRSFIRCLSLSGMVGWWIYTYTSLNDVFILASMVSISMIVCCVRVRLMVGWEKWWMVGGHFLLQNYSIIIFFSTLPLL